MDYTLSQYKPETFEKLAHDLTVEKLVSVFGYPEVTATTPRTCLHTFCLPPLDQVTACCTGRLLVDNIGCQHVVHIAAELQSCNSLAAVIELAVHKFVMSFSTHQRYCSHPGHIRVHIHKCSLLDTDRMNWLLQTHVNLQISKLPNCISHTVWHELGLMSTCANFCCLLHIFYQQQALPNGCICDGCICDGRPCCAQDLDTSLQRSWHGSMHAIEVNLHARVVLCCALMCCALLSCPVLSGFVLHNADLPYVWSEPGKTS